MKFSLPVDEHFFLVYSGIRIHLLIDEQGDYRLVAQSCVHSHAGDKILESQMDWLRVQDFYCIRRLLVTDFIFARFWRMPKSFLQRGIIDIY